MRNATNIKSVLPGIFCLEDIQCLASEKGGFSYRAALYHDQACITVSFNCAEPAPDLKNGELVSIRWLPTMRSDHGAIQVAGLSALRRSAKYPDPKDFNPFLNVPRTWTIDRHLVNCARDLWDISSDEMRRRLLSTVLAQSEHSGSRQRAIRMPRWSKTSHPATGRRTHPAVGMKRSSLTRKAKMANS